MATAFSRHCPTCEAYGHPAANPAILSAALPALPSNDGILFSTNNEGSLSTEGGQPTLQVGKQLVNLSPLQPGPKALEICDNTVGGVVKESSLALMGPKLANDPNSLDDAILLTTVSMLAFKSRFNPLQLDTSHGSNGLPVASSMGKCPWKMALGPSSPPQGTKLTHGTNGRKYANVTLGG
ncbi:hypothetical protein BKA70DRAFT_1234470 [Coprinopsis sp. MPI-PUGE-AT-0042]|nr:hypothetical protein BKA70DRAFT_1234470 [Coprinopsis sp. MPI-PUGE-AT-0042]